MTWLLNRPPYDVQLEALRRSSGHAKYGFFAEMGCGKSAMAINDWADQFSGLETVVVVAPNSMKVEWSLLPKEWGVDVETRMWPKDELRPGTWSIINYEAVRASGFDIVKTLLNNNASMLITDESSAIKNFKSQTSKAVMDLSKRANAVRLLNGTPMSQNVLDLYPQIKCLGQLNGVNPYAYRNKYAILGGFMGRQVKGVRNEEELHALLDVCSFRAKKEDWLDLPEKIYTPVRLEMTNKQRKHYKELLEDLITMVGDDEFVAPMVLVQLDKLRQVSSGLLLDGDKSVLIEDPQNNPKIKATLDIIEGGPGKVIVVHYYSRMGSVLYDFMQKQGLNPAYLRGGMAPEEVREQKDKFNTDPSCRVLIGQLKTTSLGHTLLGGPGHDRCSRMVMFDHTFSLLDRQQVEDRIHRGAQDRACQYFDLILSPVDNAQLQAILEKQDVAGRVVDVVRAMRAGVPTAPAP